MMHGAEKSGLVIVAGKPANKAEQPAQEGSAAMLDGFVRDSVNIPRIVGRVQLPAFEYDIHAPYAWPRSSSADAGSLMFRAMCELGSRSA